MLNNRSDEESVPNKALTEHTTNSTHALFHFTERYEHATFQNKHKGAEQNQLFDIKALFIDQMGSAPGLIHLQLH